MIERFVLIAVSLVFAIYLVVSNLSFQVEHKNLVFWRESATFFQKHYEYLNDGAIKRRYLDLCNNNAGETGLWYKDECVK